MSIFAKKEKNRVAMIKVGIEAQADLRSSEIVRIVVSVSPLSDVGYKYCITLEFDDKTRFNPGFYDLDVVGPAQELVCTINLRVSRLEKSFFVSFVEAVSSDAVRIFNSVEDFNEDGVLSFEMEDDLDLSFSKILSRGF